MVSVPETSAPEAQVCVADATLDPMLPIVFSPRRDAAQAVAVAQNQRNRRSNILASVRRLLLEEGCEGVTVRRIAEYSGHAVQTVYNLVGPRDAAITEAISEYCEYITLGGLSDPDDPTAAIEKCDQELRSIEANPEYCRKVCGIFFSEYRHIFYDFRDRQVRYLNALLNRQKKQGIIRDDVKSHDLAQQIMFFTSSLCVEWADRPFPFDVLQRRMYGGYANLLAGATTSCGGRLYWALTDKIGASSQRDPVPG